MQIFEIIEARKNPEQNPKTPINKIIINALDAATSDVAGITNVFVSFTTVDKLGINPKSDYDTPLGIYAYPAVYVEDTIGPNRQMARLPFAGNSPYVNIFNAAGNIINIATITEKELVPYYKKIIEIVARYNPDLDAKHEVKSIFNNSETLASVKSLPGGKFWYVTLEIARNFLKINLKTSTPVAWNKLFRMLGIDGVVDYTLRSGKGIIHPNEPSQAVFFSINAVTNVKRYDNKYSPDYMQNKKESGSEKKEAAQNVINVLRSTNDPDTILQVLRDNRPSYTFKLIRDQKLKDYIITNSPDLVFSIPNPTEHEYALAVKAKPAYAINIASRVPNASPQLQVLLANASEKSLMYFDPPSKEAIQAVITKYTEEELVYPKWLVSMAKTAKVPLQQKQEPAALTDARQELKAIEDSLEQLLAAKANAANDWKIAINSATDPAQKASLQQYAKQELAGFEKTQAGYLIKIAKAKTLIKQLSNEYYS